MAEGSVTRWIQPLRNGDDEASAEIWQRYFSKLVAASKQALGTAPRGAADEEDVVASAFKSFCGGAATGRFPVLNSRLELWKILITITLRKADKQRRREETRRTIDESTFLLDLLASSDPTPECAAQVKDTVSHLLGELQSDLLRQVAVAKLHGFTNREIAGHIGKSVPTVERKLRLIRDIWTDRDE